MHHRPILFGSPRKQNDVNGLMVMVLCSNMLKYMSEGSIPGHIMLYFTFCLLGGRFSERKKRQKCHISGISGI